MKLSLRLTDALMRIIRTIAQILILYVFYYIGVLIVKVTGLPLPASILGLVLLAVCLKMKWVKVEYIREGAGFLIAFMTLFFIPAIVGIIDYPELLSLEGILLLSTVFVSTLFAILISSKLSEMIEKKELAMIEKKEAVAVMQTELDSVEEKDSHVLNPSASLKEPQQNEKTKEDEILEGSHLHR
ncbi:CidA/LrgA family protein [Ureibacillus chungkukjangi]|uniref:Holin-like protein n=1 Tax=Ureibacillus chungkukjangi TaxID=1202712 RepID=A0A318TNV4_9BACL|nr:CidA/LrgA family protein [Ureibacillus chungkukjangi]PYF06456.1 holin-like protein [Ureibacillus chungkukjangi]